MLKPITGSILLVSLMFLHLAASSQKFDLFLPLSERHQRIGSTNVFMIIPDGFVMSDYFDGIEHLEEKECGIVISMIPGPYSRNVLRFDEDLLSLRGLTVHSSLDYDFGEYRGRYLHAQQDGEDESVLRTSFIFGDENRSFVLHGVAPLGQEELALAITDALTSIRFKDVTLDAPRSLLDYTVNEKKSPFQLATVLVNGMIFTIDGKLPPETENRTIVFFDKSHTRLRIFDPRQFSIERLKLYPGAFRVTKEEDLKKIKASGMHGYSIYAINAQNPLEHLLQNIVFKKDGTYYVMTALINDNYEENLQIVKNLYSSFKVKRVFGG